MSFWSLVNFLFHLSTFVSIALLASLFVLPFLTISFALSSAIVVLSVASRLSFQTGIFFYDRFVMFLQAELRSMVDQMPANQGPARKDTSALKKGEIQDGPDTTFARKQPADAPLIPHIAASSSSSSAFRAEILGTQIPLQSIEESLLDSQ